MANPEPSERSRMVAATFDQVAVSYDTVGVPWFRPIAEHLVLELAPRPGERALDIGSGRGAVLFPLAEAVGPTGHVTAIDLAPGMVQALRQDVADRGLDQVDVLIQDAANPDLDPVSFDLVASSLVLFFLPDPAAAVRRWHDLLVPGGRIGITSFGPRDPHFVAVDAVFTPFLPPQMLDARASGTEGVFASDAGLEGLLTSAGSTQSGPLTWRLMRFSGTPSTGCSGPGRMVSGRCGPLSRRIGTRRSGLRPPSFWRPLGISPA